MTEPARRLADNLTLGFSDFLATEVPRLRALEHGRVCARVDEIVEMVRKRAVVEAYNLALEDVQQELEKHTGDWQRALAERIKALPTAPTRPGLQVSTSGGRDGG